MSNKKLWLIFGHYCGEMITFFLAAVVCLVTWTLNYNNEFPYWTYLYASLFSLWGIINLGLKLYFIDFGSLFYVVWYDRATDELIDQFPLFGIGPAKIRKIFGLKPDEYPGDCLEITPEQWKWIRKQVPILPKEPRPSYEYYVEIREAYKNAGPLKK